MRLNPDKCLAAAASRRYFTVRRETTAAKLVFLLFIFATPFPSFGQDNRAVDRGFLFLIKVQNADGSFGYATDPNQRIIDTSTSLLAFVSAGQAPDLGKFGSAVRAATDYLIKAASDKLSPQARTIRLIALSELAGIDDNAQDQTALTQLLGPQDHDPPILPFSGNLVVAARTLLSLHKENLGDKSSPFSYSISYRLAVFAAQSHLDNLTQRIESILTSLQQDDGSWNKDAQSTAYAILALTAHDHLMPLSF